MSLLDDALLALPGGSAFSMYLADGRPPQRLGSTAAYAAPNEAYPTSDGYVMVAAYPPTRWAALSRAMGMPELAAVPRFRNEREASGGERRDLAAVVSHGVRTRHRRWIGILDERADILCGPLLGYPG